MQPEFRLGHLFPDRDCETTLSLRELERFADFWDDSESDESNLAAISHWVEQRYRMEDSV